jgi:hypothetical protein
MRPGKKGRGTRKSRISYSVCVQAAGAARDLNNLFTVIFDNISLAKWLAESSDAARNDLTEAERACLKAIDLRPNVIAVAGGRSTGNYLPASAKTSKTKADKD